MTKYVVGLVAALFLISCGKGNDAHVATTEMISQNDPLFLEDSEESDESVMTPEQEVEYYTSLQVLGKARAYKFAQTTWKECTDPTSGNYYNYKCASSRNISSILKSFMDKHISKCVNKGLAAQGGGSMADLHIVHAGITGDPNHSPKSLHAENRAIDIKSLQVKLTSGASKTFTFSGSGSSAFFNAFRSCWGDVVRTYNGCPTYNGVLSYTGSIGKEDKNHQHHMHTSVPYCVGGSYGPYYYRR